MLFKITVRRDEIYFSLTVDLEQLDNYRLTNLHQVSNKVRSKTNKGYNIRDLKNTTNKKVQNSMTDGD